MKEGGFTGKHCLCSESFSLFCQCTLLPKCYLNKVRFCLSLACVSSSVVSRRFYVNAVLKSLLIACLHCHAIRNKFDTIQYKNRKI